MKYLLLIQVFILAFTGYSQDCGEYIYKNKDNKFLTKSIVIENNKYKVGFSIDSGNHLYFYTSFKSLDNPHWSDQYMTYITFENGSELNLNTDRHIYTPTKSNYYTEVHSQLTKSNLETFKELKVVNIKYDYRNMNVKINKKKSNQLNLYLSCLINSFDEAVNYSPIVSVSTKKRKEMSINRDDFSHDYDEFQQATFIRHKKSGFYNIYGVSAYLYIVENESIIPKLRMVVKYKEARWLFIDKITFLNDQDETYSIEVDTETDVLSNSNVYEMTDFQVDSDFFQYLNKLKNYSMLKCRLSGKYSLDFKLTNIQMSSIYETLQYYKELI